MSDVLVLAAADVSRVVESFAPVEIVRCGSCGLLSRQIHAIGAALHAAAVGPAEDIDAPLRISTQNEHHTYLYMPARWAETTSIKCVAVPKRGAGLPASTLVFDHPTGQLAALVNAAELTAIRTAYGSRL